MEPISTAIAAFGAVQQAVSLIKKAAATVDDVASLGPLLGRYFDAKHNAVKAVRETKKSGGSHMAKAIEIEMAIKQQADFEKELQMLFMTTGNVDVWNNIQQRVAEMEREERREAERERIRERKRKQAQAEMIEILLAIVLAIVLLVGTGWVAYEFIMYCRTAQCSKK